MIVGVRFSPSGRVHFYDDNGVRVEFADRVMVQTECGDKAASIVIGSGQVAHSDLNAPLPRVLKLIQRAPKIP
ncbi:MAG: hypothetical protein F4Y49_15955 [Dehalococcoidia bacterium]|nr:hypothetical protein [Dehalococcoidia bacterium]